MDTQNTLETLLMRTHHHLIKLINLIIDQTLKKTHCKINQLT